MADLVFEYNIKKLSQIFDEDKNFKKVLIDYGLYIPNTTIDEQNPLRMNMYYDLSELLLSEYDFLSSRSIDDLWTLRYRITNLNDIFNKVDIIDYVLYKQIIFTFKYSTLKHFFKENFTHFLPYLDAGVINDSEKMKIFQTAFMQEYDKFADIIEEVNNITDIDKVGNDYLSYLVQLLGYEKGDDKLLGTDSFRELAKNIIEVYRIKGTNYSFELFFNFLGFDVELKEFWFDKRYADAGISINPYTGADNPLDYSFYLTPEKPTDTIPKNMVNPYQVNENNLTNIRSHLWWSKKIELGSSIAKLLNEDPEDLPEKDFDYTYFKTNIIQYSVKRIRSKETDADELSADDEKIIQAYADFLTPIFISKQILITINPFEDVAEKLLFKDSSIYDFNLETFVNMFKTSSNWYISDPYDINFIDLTDVDEHGIDSEEPKEFILLIDTNHSYPDNLFTKDYMKQYIDDDPESDYEFSVGKSFKTIHISTLRNELADNAQDTLVSLYDLDFTDKSIMLQLFYQMFPVDDPDGMTGLHKITDYVEDLFSRTSRLEELDVFNRDYYDWDDFHQIVEPPTFSDSIDQMMKLNSFDVDTTITNKTIYTNNDDSAATVPWFFYDSLITTLRKYNWLGFGFATMSTTIIGQLEFVRSGSGSGLLLGGIQNPTSMILLMVAFGKVNVLLSSTEHLFDIEREGLCEIVFSADDIIGEVTVL